MGHRSEVATPDNSDEESGDAFTDGDFGDSDDDTVLERSDTKSSNIPVNETVNESIEKSITNGNCSHNGHEASPADDQPKVNGRKNSDNQSDVENYSASSEVRRDSHGEQNPSIVGILGDQHNHAEQRLAARRAARAEAREIRMRELERQQREQEDHADKAYDMYAETVGRRGGTRLATLSPAASLVLTPRRSSEDADDTFSIKDLRHELKEVEEKFRKAMILNAQLDNDKAALQYQLELLKDRVLELQEEHAQLQREHRETCSAETRLRREHISLERELTGARDAVRARDAAAMCAGFAFAEAAPGATHAEGFGAVPPLALLSVDNERELAAHGEGTLDVRLQKLVTAKQELESEVRKLKLTLNEERAARQNGVAGRHDQDLEDELETLRRSVSEAKGRAARAEAEAALQAAGVARLEAQLQRLRARSGQHDEREDQLKQERRKLQREAREALNRVEELETENSHLTKRLDKLKNAKSALLKDL